MSVNDLSTRVEYRQIERFPGYRFGDDGSVWTCRELVMYRGPGTKGLGSRSVLGEHWRRMAPQLWNGYLGVCLQCDESGKLRNRRFLVHRLVLEAFSGPCPPGMQCRHLDGDRQNNLRDNLRWATPKVNNADKRRHGTAQVGERHGLSKLTWVKVAEIRKLRAEGVSAVALGERFGVLPATIRQIVRRDTWINPPV